MGADNKKIGDVSDILFDKNGKIEAYVVSVGGFLGMGAQGGCASAEFIRTHCRQERQRAHPQALVESARAEAGAKLQALRTATPGDHRVGRSRRRRAATAEPDGAEKQITVGIELTDAARMASAVRAAAWPRRPYCFFAFAR